MTTQDSRQVNDLVTSFIRNRDTSGYAELIKSVEDNSRNGADREGNFFKYKFPETLFNGDGNRAFVIFEIISSVAGPIPIGTIALYMPPDLRISYTAQYEETVLSAENFINQVGTGARVIYDSSGKPISSAGAIAGDLATSGLNRGSFIGSTSIRNRLLANPHSALLYKGPTFRQLKLDFQMMPRNQKESENIRTIIKMFKSAQHPSFTGEAKTTFNYPENFLIHFFSPTSEYLFRMAPTVLVNVEVGYTPEIASFFSGTGAPVDQRLSLTFQEITIISKEDIDQFNF